MLLMVWVLTGPGLTAFDVQFPDFSREASASSYPNSSYDHLKTFDHIILTWIGNPVTSQAVTWRSLVDFKSAAAEIAPAKSSPDFMKSARQFLAATASLKIDGRFVYYHSVNFTELTPDTLYAYRVGNGDLWSEWFQFRTASRFAEPFSFLYFGDAQKNIFSLWSRTLRAAILKSSDARFMIHAGDLVDRPNYEQEWNEWFNAGDPIFATLPSIPATGNHEYRKWKNKSLALSKFWRPQFSLPENGISGLAETSYFLDYQGARIVVLDSNQKLERQARWLENVLKGNPNHWTIVVFHHPVYSSIPGRDNKLVRKHWEPLFDKFGVDLVLQGHDHVYARGRGAGPVYVTSVSGPKMYDLARAEWMDRAGQNMQLFQLIAISGSVLNYQSITVTGEVFDAFELVKKDGKASRLINKIPVE